MAYNRTSRASQALIVSFSVALMLMIGWFALLIMFSPDANTKTAEPFAALSPDEPPRVENPSAAPFPIVRPVKPSEARSSPLDAASASIAPPPSASSPQPAGTAGAAAPPEAPAPSPDALATASAGAATIDFRTAPNDYLHSEEAAPVDISPVPLPVPRPRRVASAPLPRPRPHMDDEAEAQPAQERSFLDILFDRQH